MLYTEQEWQDIRAQLRARRWRVYIPFGILCAVAVAAYIITQSTRMAAGWWIVSAAVILAGAFLIFFGDVYIVPMRNYERHIDLMLHGRQRETRGLLKEVETELCIREGVSCRRIWLNVGEKNADEDDRQLYLDALKPMPDIPLGTQVIALSNSNMLSSLRAAE